MGETDSRTISPVARRLGGCTIASRALAGCAAGSGVRGTIVVGWRLLDGHLGAILEFVESGDGNRVTGIHTLYGSEAAIGGANGDGLHRGGLIGLHHIN